MPFEIFCVKFCIERGVIALHCNVSPTRLVVAVSTDALMLEK